MNIRDDRGRLITLRGEMRARAGREWRRGWMRHFGFFVFSSVLLAMLSGFVTMAALAVMGYDAEHAIRKPSLFLLIGAAGGVVLSGIFRDHLNPVRSIKTCGGCNYPLVKLPVERDGCRVCPECGGAWRVPRSGGTA